MPTNRTGSQTMQGGQGSAGSIYRFDANNLIAQTPTGWRWYDWLGSSVHYDTAGGQLGSHTYPGGSQQS